jgi:hypothetical protein
LLIDDVAWQTVTLSLRSTRVASGTTRMHTIAWRMGSPWPVTTTPGWSAMDR